MALLGAVVGAVAIRAKKNNGEHRLTVEAAEANVNPGGSAVAAREAAAGDGSSGPIGRGLAPC